MINDNFDLSLFDGGSASGAASAGTAAGSGVSNSGGAGQQTGASASNPGAADRGTGDIGSLVSQRLAEAGAETSATAENDGNAGKNGDTGHGAPEEDGEKENAAQTASDRAKRYADARREFADEFQRDMQKIMDKRWAKAKQTEDKLAGYQSVMDILAQKYAIKDGNVDSIKAAINNDNAFWESIAEDLGTDVSHAKRFTDLEIRERSRQQAESLARAQMETDRAVQSIIEQAKQTAKQYPGFDLRVEMENPAFKALLQNKALMMSQNGVTAAYLAVHPEAVQGVVARSGAAVEDAMTKHIQANGTRPKENGTAAGTGTVTKTDVSKLTREQRAQIVQLVKSGKTYSFN